jgi:hypothetical protein
VNFAFFFFFLKNHHDDSENPSHDFILFVMLPIINQNFILFLKMVDNSHTIPIVSQESIYLLLHKSGGRFELIRFTISNYDSLRSDL